MWYARGLVLFVSILILSSCHVEDIVEDLNLKKMSGAVYEVPDLTKPTESRPLAGAQVILQGSGDGQVITTTGADGRFTGKFPSPYSILRFSKEGYGDITQEVFVDTNVSLSIRLVRKPTCTFTIESIDSSAYSSYHTLLFKGHYDHAPADPNLYGMLFSFYPSLADTLYNTNVIQYLSPPGENTDTVSLALYNADRLLEDGVLPGSQLYLTTRSVAISVKDTLGFYYAGSRKIYTAVGPSAAPLPFTMPR